MSDEKVDIVNVNEKPVNEKQINEMSELELKAVIYDHIEIIEKAKQVMKVLKEHLDMKQAKG